MTRPSCRYSPHIALNSSCPARRWSFDGALPSPAAHNFRVLGSHGNLLIPTGAELCALCDGSGLCFSFVRRTPRFCSECVKSDQPLSSDRVQKRKDDLYCPGWLLGTKIKLANTRCQCAKLYIQANKYYFLLETLFEHAGLFNISRRPPNAWYSE